MLHNKIDFKDNDASIMKLTNNQQSHMKGSANYLRGSQIFP